MTSGDRDRTRCAFWTLLSFTMGDSEEEDNWNSTSGEDDGDTQGCDDEVEVVIQTTSESVSGFNKMRPEDMTTVNKRKEILPEEVYKNNSVLDQ